MENKIALIKRDGVTIGIFQSHPSIGALPWFHNNVHAYSMAHAIEHEGYSVEYSDGPDCTEVEGIIAAICARVGVTMTAEFVPFSKSRNAKPAKPGDKPWKSLNWRVTFKSSAGHTILTTDYSSGTGHCPASKAKESAFIRSNYSVKAARAEAVEWEIENGKEARCQSWGIIGGKPILPSVGEVMQSLARDCDVLDAGGFASWAGDLGYDTDSRTAETIYKTCIEQALALRAGVGDAVLTELRLAAGFN